LSHLIIIDFLRTNEERCVQELPSFGRKIEKVEAEIFGREVRLRSGLGDDLDGAVGEKPVNRLN